jgi:hypothetical protein
VRNSFGMESSQLSLLGTSLGYARQTSIRDFL